MRSLLAIAIVCGACGGDDGIDMTGVYKVDSVVGSEPCGTDTPAAMPPGFLRLNKENFLGVEFWEWRGCAMADTLDDECDLLGGLLGGFFEPISGGWRGDGGFSIHGGGTSCTLGYSEQTAKLSGGSLTIEASQYSGEFELTDEQCTSEEAQKRGKTMMCGKHAVYMATKQ